MLHPSYTDLMKVVNREVEIGEQPVVNSRYSIVIATSKRARQLIGGEEALVMEKGKKPLSIAIEELNSSKVKIVSDDEHKKEELFVNEDAAAIHDYDTIED
ncbi:DNA-directed RNA polymerase subunit omega [Anaerosacchariphilus polymeriproducens]|uniref:DNA-directed RNA polymerase subunit omega n=1 Tax=Anaerosacchariphilus polymeriproducens TaxID=1812858 RepID=A0A371AZ75_9FIRM|nr:DNA-directed RNA polymerase subunit omega [Anaerosacchariphilus polymeriproducens]RDU24853.1 DNA-directed RNA polymerase subunit omega [Anaerosacchariphilus polymeriproducens]